MKTYNRNAIKELFNRGYLKRHIAIVMGCTEPTIREIRKQLDAVEPTLKFLTVEEKQRLLVLDRLLELQPVGIKWSSNDYYYITILKFLLVSREQVYNIYKSAPLIQVARAYKEKVPKFKSFDYRALQVNSEEYYQFVMSCYKILGDPTKYK